MPSIIHQTSIIITAVLFLATKCCADEITQRDCLTLSHNEDGDENYTRSDDLPDGLAFFAPLIDRDYDTVFENPTDEEHWLNHMK